MSVAVGIKSPNGVHLATDSYMSTETEGCNVNHKLFVVKDVGFCVVDNFRHAQIVEHHLGRSMRNMALAHSKPMSWIVTSLVPTLQKLMDKHDAWSGLADEDAKGLNMLIAVGGEIFALQDDWAVISPREGYTSVGSGSATANGALHATADLADCKKRCYKAVKAAAHHVPNVAEPVQYLFVKAPERDK